MVSVAIKPGEGQIQCTFPYIQLIIKVFEKWYNVNDWDLRPVSVVPTTASLMFLNPAVLVAMTTIL